MSDLTDQPVFKMNEPGFYIKVNATLLERKEDT